MIDIAAALAAESDFIHEVVPLSELDEGEKKAVVHVWELNIEQRAAYRANGLLKTKAKDGSEEAKYDDTRDSLSLVVEATKYPDGRKVFPDGAASIETLLKAKGRWEPIISKLLAAAIRVNFLSVAAKVTARKNSKATPNSGTS